MLRENWALPKEKTPETMVKQELLRMVSELPHLAGVVHLLKIHFTDRVDLAAITGSGVLLINPETFVRLPSWEATFVLAHECMHLCLKHHERDFGKYPLWTNIAMDAVINDMLSQKLQMFVPCNGVVLEGARYMSFERILSRMIANSDHKLRKKHTWSPLQVPPQTPMETILVDSGLVDTFALPRHGMDLIVGQMEQEMFPELVKSTRHRRKQISRVAKAATVFRRYFPQPKSMLWARDSGDEQEQMNAESIGFVAELHQALQVLVGGTSSNGRSYARSSRRNHYRDVIRPGKGSQGAVTMHIVLDTSGSMYSDLPFLLGVIADFCMDNNVGTIHIVQCDTMIQNDEWLSPDQLYDYTVHGLGGSDMTHAMEELAKDSAVYNAVVITDGMIDCPQTPMPYEVLWLLPANGWKCADYGTIVRVPQINESFPPEF